MQKKGGLKVDPTMFPNEASDAFPLDRCMRVLPHHGKPLKHSSVLWWVPGFPALACSFSLVSIVLACHEIM